MIYSSTFTEKYYLEFSTYYNDAEIIDWQSDDNTSVPIGDLQTLGFETELSYKFDIGNIGVNYAGAKDGLLSLTTALQGEPEEAAAAQSIARINKEGTYATNFCLNSSVSISQIAKQKLYFICKTYSIRTTMYVGIKAKL